MRSSVRFACVLLSVLTALSPLGGQTPTTVSPGAGARQQPSVVQPEVAAADDPAGAVSQANYVVRPSDQVLIRVPSADELNDRSFRVDSEGKLTMPLAGTIVAAGLTVEQLESEITDKLKTYIRSPLVSISVTQFRADPVFVTGAFGRPGVHALQPPRRLLEFLSAIGGLQPNASRRIQITRRLEQGALRLPAAQVDEKARVSSAEITLNELMETSSPDENILLAPYDTLHASKAGMVYLTFAGARAGAYPVDEREYLSVVQLIALAGGVAPGSDPENARILRPVLNTARRAEIPVDVKAILEGKRNDYPLMPNDVLLVPQRKGVGRAMGRTLTFAVPAVVTTVIWQVLRPR